MSGSRSVTPGAFFRDPAMPRSSTAYCATGSPACRTAVSRIIRLTLPRARSVASAAGNRPSWARVRCAATSRTRQPSHSNGVSHSGADSSSGYVRRVPDPADARARLVRIAARGQAAVSVAREAEAAVEAEWTRHLGGTSASQLRRALTRLREITDPYQ